MDTPLVEAVECAAIVVMMLPSVLFGYEAGRTWCSITDPEKGPIPIACAVNGCALVVLGFIACTTWVQYTGMGAFAQARDVLGAWTWMFSGVLCFLVGTLGACMGIMRYTEMIYLPWASRPPSAHEATMKHHQ